MGAPNVLSIAFEFHSDVPAHLASWHAMAACTAGCICLPGHAVEMAHLLLKLHALQHAQHWLESIRCFRYALARCGSLLACQQGHRMAAEVHKHLSWTS